MSWTSFQVLDICLCQCVENYPIVFKNCTLFHSSESPNVPGPNLGCSSSHLGLAINCGFWLHSHLASPNALTLLVLLANLALAFWTRFSLLDMCLVTSSLFRSWDWQGSWPWRRNQADGMNPNDLSLLTSYPSLYDCLSPHPPGSTPSPWPWVLSLCSPVQS